MENGSGLASQEEPQHGMMMQRPTDTLLFLHITAFSFFVLFYPANLFSPREWLLMEAGVG